MNEKQLVVPEGMVDAATKVLPLHVQTQLGAMVGFPGMVAVLEAALRWLTEHPIVPTPGQWKACINYFAASIHGLGEGTGYEACGEWVKHMFDAPKPKPKPKEDHDKKVIDRYSLTNKGIEKSDDGEYVLLSDVQKGILKWNENAEAVQRLLDFVRGVSPEPAISPAAKRAIESLRGVTLTPADANAIMDEVSTVAHGWTAMGYLMRPTELSDMKAEPLKSPYIYQPVVPEAIKDLVFDKDSGEELNANQTRVVLEAYRRGLQSGKESK